MADYELGAVLPHVRAAANEMGPKFGITVIGGYRTDARDKTGHPAGRALDFMTTNGQALADYARANAARLKVEYVIWNQRIWSVARNAEGWRPMEDRGDDTQNHKDHVHVNFTDGGDAVGGDWSTAPQAAGAPTVTGGWQNGGSYASGIASGERSWIVSGIVRSTLITSVFLGGGLLIVLGAAKVTKPQRDQATQQATTALSVLPQGKAAAAATAATKTPKGTPA